MRLSLDVAIALKSVAFLGSYYAISSKSPRPLVVTECTDFEGLPPAFTAIVKQFLVVTHSANHLPRRFGTLNQPSQAATDCQTNDSAGIYRSHFLHYIL